MYYLANSFSLNMIQDSTAHVIIKFLTKSEFCEKIKTIDKSYIGHEATAKFIEQLCNQKVEVNRGELKLKHGDVVFVIQLRTRLPENRVLTLEELNEMLSKNMIVFYEVKYFSYKPRWGIP